MELETKIVSRMILTLLLIGMLTLAFNIQPIRADSSPIRNQNPDVSLIYVLVNGSIYDDVKLYIDRYVSDVERLGFNASVLSISGGSPEDVRTILMNASSEGLVGCLLVGDVPWALYEMDDPDYGYEEFPIDLFYMDLDGVWTDTDSDGRYDQHTGDRVPEIWVGRIKASGMAGSEVSLIQNYFDKNHDYRTGALSLPNRALIYIDDDWADRSGEVDSAVRLVYNNRTLVNENATTHPADYLGRLKQNWSLVHLMVHGEPDLHYFMTNGEWVGNVTSSDIRSKDPHAFFYNLFSCSNAKYSEVDYISGWYVFSDTYGIAAVSSTKTGGMWFFSDFYSKFRRETLGFSFREWLTKRVVEEDANPSGWYDKSWYYGMTILGDPTLSAKPEVGNVAITNINPYRTVLSNNTFTSINVTTQNRGDTIENFNVTLYCNASQIGTQTVTISAGQSTVLTFEWNATVFEYGNYTLKAYANPVPGEIDIEDNTLVKGVIITIPGDVDGDYDVDLYDVVKVCSAYGSNKGDPGYDPNFDVNCDDKIDLYDVVIVCTHYGEELEGQ